jgi:hypothetical protein
MNDSIPTRYQLRVEQRRRVVQYAEERRVVQYAEEQG